ncbi:hypothetical protein Tco_0215815 [Tanacetum coccineum]
MGSITSIKCVLTQEHLDAICAKYFVPEEVHPQLPSSDATMHERPTVPANARFGWFSGTNIVKDQAPTISEYNVEHANTLIAQASLFLRFPKEFICWVGISRNYLLNKDTYPRFEYENGEEMDLNAFIRTVDPRKVRIVERARTENERPIVTVAKHRTVTLLPTSVPRPSRELSASIEREFVKDAGGSGGGDQEVASVSGHGNVEPIMPTTDNIVAETEASGPKRSKKKRVTRGSESTPAASHPPKRLRADYGTTGGSAAGGKSPTVLNRLLQDSRLTVEQGVPALPTLPFITSSVTASPLEEGGDHTDSVTGTKSADPEVDSFVRSVASVMTTATTVTGFVSNAATTTATPIDVVKDKDVSTPSIFSGSSSSDKMDRTLSLFTGRSGSNFVAGSIHAGGDADVDLQEIYIPEWSVTKGFELNDERSCANMIDHFTPPAFFKAIRGMEHEQLFAEFNVSAACNLSLSSEDKEIRELRSQLLQAKDESMEVAQLCTRVSNLESIKGLLRGEVASAKEHNGLLEQERSALKLKVTGLESIIAKKDRELSDLGTSSSSLRSQNQSLVNQVHELETSSAGLREKLETYEGSMKQLEEFQDNLMKPLEARLAEIDADFTRCCMHFQENFHSHLLNATTGQRWLLTHGMKLLMAKCLNSTEYMEALGNAFGRAIEKRMQEGLAARIEHGQVERCLSDLKAYNPSAKADFNYTVRDLHGLDFPLLRELSANKDASTWDVMDLLRLDDAMAEVLGMTDLQPDVGQLMVPVHHKQDKVVIESQALSVALETCHNHLVSAKALTILPETSTEPLVMVLITTALSTMVIRPNSDPFLLVEDYENPDLAGAVSEDVIPGPECEGKVGGSTEGDVDVGDLVFSQLENEAKDTVL